MRFRGDEVRRQRLYRGESVAECAEKAGITRQQWQYIENGTVKMPRSITAKAIARVLDVELSSLYEDVES